MIQINVFIFLILLQALVITTAVIIYLIYRNNKLKEQFAEPESNAETEPSQPLPYVNSYLAAEVEATKLQLTTQTQESDQDDPTSNPMALRLEYLQLEQLWTGNQERDENFWSALNDRMQELLGKFAGQAQETDLASTLPMDDEGKILSQELIEKQANTIKVLKELLSQANLDAEKSKSLEDSVAQISQTNLELTHCVAVLEDENGFLRDQIQALVKGNPSPE